MALEKKKNLSLSDPDAMRDWLTKLPNRFSFNQKIKKSLSDAQRTGTKLGVILIDLDNFKDINDTYGHQEGDFVLKRAVACLSKLVEKPGYLVRWGGDEFLWILPGVKSEECLTAKFPAILEAIHSIGTNHPQALELTASIGYALYPDHGRTISSLIEGADYVMYQIKRWRKRNAPKPTAPAAKKTGRRTPAPPYVFFRRLCSSINNGHIFVSHQPIWDMRTHQPAAIECLLYWRDDELGETISADYIPIARHTKIMLKTGYALMEKMLLEYKGWKKITPSLRLAINLSHILD